MSVEHDWRLVVSPVREDARPCRFTSITLWYEEPRFS